MYNGEKKESRKYLYASKQGLYVNNKQDKCLINHMKTAVDGA